MSFIRKGTDGRSVRKIDNSTRRDSNFVGEYWMHVVDVFANNLKVDAQKLVDEQRRDREALVRDSSSWRALLSSTAPGNRTTHPRP